MCRVFWWKHDDCHHGNKDGNKRKYSANSNKEIRSSWNKEEDNTEQAFSQPFLIEPVQSVLPLLNEVDNTTGDAGAMILIHGGDISTKYAKVKASSFLTG
jgi:hypothetical protein